MQGAPLLERPPRRWPWLVALLALALPLLTLRLGAKDLWEASEGRPPESAREMAQRGDWLVPTSNGEVDLTKPPIYAWLVGLSFQGLGESEGAARVPSVLAAAGILALTFLFAQRLAGACAGLLAGLVLLTASRFLWQARLAELETLLALGVTGAFVALGAALDREPGRERTARFAAGWAALGFALAVKGPIAFLLVLPGLLAFAWWTRRLRALVSPAALLTFPLALAIGGAWPLAVVLRDPATLDTFLSYSTGQNAGHRRDALYYLWQGPLALLPWTPLVLVGLALPRAPGLDARVRDGTRLCVAGLAGGLLALSLLPWKQTHYLIPLFPLAAVLAAVAVERAVAGPAGRVRVALGVCALLVLAAAVTLTFDLDGGLLPRTGAGVLARSLSIAPLILGLEALRALRRRALGWAACCVLLGAGLLEGHAVGVVVPALNEAYSPRAFLERSAGRVPPGRALASGIFGSHSEHLWYLRRTVLPLPDAAAVDRYFAQGGERYALLFQDDVARLGGRVEVLERDDAFQKKDRRVALVVSRETVAPAGAGR